MKFKRSVLILGLFGLFVNTYSQIEFREIENEEDWLAAVEDARSSEKLLFLDIYATWCGPCKYLENNVYTDKDLGNYYNSNFVNLKMDGESEFGAQVARKYQLSAYPTMYYLYPSEDIISTIVGVREAGPLNSLGKTIYENADKLKYYEANFADGTLNPTELKNYQSILVKLEQEEKAANVAGQILPKLSEEEILSPQYKKLVVSAAVDINSRTYKIISQNSAEISEKWTRTEIETFYEGVFNNTLISAINNRDQILLQRIINELLPVYMGDNSQDLPRGIFVTKKLYYANTGDWQKYDSLVNNEFKKTGSNHTFLYMQAYEVANEYNQSPEAVELAIDWMLRASELKPSFDNLVLTSYLHAMTGDFKVAREYIGRMKGMELTDEQQKVLEELEKTINQASTG